MKWVFLAIFALLVPVLAIVTGLALSKRNRGGEAVAPVNRRLDFDQEDVRAPTLEGTGPLAWFHEHSTEAFEEAVGILEVLNGVGSPAEVPERLRDSEVVLEKIAVSGPGWSSSS